MKPHFNAPLVVMTEMRKKLVDKSIVTEDDLSRLAKAARSLGSIESRVTYAAVKLQFDNQPKPDENTKMFIDSLERLKNNGTITNEEYESQKKSILEDGIEGA